MHYWCVQRRAVCLLTHRSLCPSLGLGVTAPCAVHSTEGTHLPSRAKAQHSSVLPHLPCLPFQAQRNCVAHLLHADVTWAAARMSAATRTHRTD